MRRASAVALIAMSQAASAQTAPSAAAQLLQATPAEARAGLLQPFTKEARSDWHYTPRRRAGIAWRAP